MPLAISSVERVDTGTNPPRFTKQKPIRKAPLAPRPARDYLGDQAGAALLVNGYIPVALSKSEGAGSVRTVVWLPGAHL
ncbi:hypothetical protein NBRC116586_20740 [Pseudooceanicola nitratireducens]